MVPPTGLARRVKYKIAAAVVAAGLTIATSLAVMWEGGPRYVAFKPIPTDPWTICHGHTRGVTQGMTATREQCEQWLREDMQEASQAVQRCIDWPLTANQFGAFSDASFNIGPRVVCGSTLQRKANAGDIRGACDELARWTFAGGKHYRGLANRRADERAVCWPDFSTVRGGVHA